MILFTLVTLLSCFLKAATGAVLSRAAPLPPFITMEEHFNTPEIAPQDAGQAPAILQRLADLGSLRLKEMDQAKITKQ